MKRWTNEWEDELYEWIYFVWTIRKESFIIILLTELSIIISFLTRTSSMIS